MKRILLTLFIWLAAMIFLIEEFIWDWAARLMACLGAVRLVHAVEQLIVELPPRWAVFAFLLPSSTLIPAKLVGLHAMANGHWIFGSMIFLMAKLIGMALFSRIFNLTRPALMQVRWFARFYEKVMHYRNRIHAYLDHWLAYQRAKQRIRSLIGSIKGKDWFLS